LREYELTVIYDLAVMEAGGADASVQALTTHVEARAGKVARVDHWGRRRLAYPIGRALDGDYIVTRVEMEPASVTALEGAMNIDERILRHLIVRADELPPPPQPREPRRMPEQAAPAQAAPAPEAAAPSAVVAATAEAEAPAPAEAPIAAVPPEAPTVASEAPAAPSEEPAAPAEEPDAEAAVPEATAEAASDTIPAETPAS
jgi:small subunit ribosomal protein S6